MKKLLLVLLVLTGVMFSAGQDLAGTMYGVYGEGLGSATTVEIPNYGIHGVVKLTTTMLPAEEVRDTGLAVFTALTTGRSGIVSVSVHGREGFGQPEYVVVFQKLEDGTVAVYLDGVPF